MSLTSKDKKQLRVIGHHLNPVVTVAERGLSDSVLAELERALRDHELIKVKLAVGDRSQRRELVTKFCQALDAEVVQEIGRIALIFKASDEETLRTSNVRHVE